MFFTFRTHGTENFQMRSFVGNIRFEVGMTSRAIVMQNCELEVLSRRHYKEQGIIECHYQAVNCGITSVENVKTFLPSTPHTRNPTRRLRRGQVWLG